MPMERWMASAAGGTIQRLNFGPAMMRSRDSIPAAAVVPDMVLPPGSARTQAARELAHGKWTKARCHQTKVEPRRPRRRAPILIFPYEGDPPMKRLIMSLAL